MTITTPIQPAPTTPLNLRFDVIYAPREATPPLAGYMVIAVCDGSDDESYAVLGYEPNGTGVELFRGPLSDAYARMATYLRMGGS